MKNYFFLLLVLISNLIYSQKNIEIDTLTYKNLKNQYDSNFKKNKRALTQEKFFKFIRVLELKADLACKTETEECSSIKYLLGLAIREKMYQIHQPKNEIDSLLFYHNYLIEKSLDNYSLAKSAIIVSQAMLNKSDISGFLDKTYESIEYFKKSDSKYAPTNKFTCYQNLIRIYGLNGYQNFAFQTLNIFETELNALKNDEQYDKYLRKYKAAKAMYLVIEEKYDESIAVLKESLNDSENNVYNKFVIYDELINALIKAERYTEALTYYNLAFTKESEKIGIPIYHKMKLGYEVKLFRKLKEFDKYEAAVKDFLKLTKKGSYLYNNTSSHYYKYKKDYEKAYYYLNLSLKEKDSLAKVKANISKEITAFKLRKDSELKSLEFKNKQKEAIISKDKKILVAVIVVLILLSCLLTAIVYFIKNKKNYAIQLKLEKSEEINLSKNTFLENISHEVRTPITIINGYLSLIKESILEPKKVLEYTSLISKNTDGLLSSLNNFLTVFKSQNLNNGKQHKETKNLDAFCENVVLDFKGVCEVKKISLYYKTNVKEKLVVEYDYFNLQKILYNLISNAIKYSNSNTSIYVALSIQKNGFQITVKDEGFGISENDQEHIFERFYQSDKHLTTGGFGIGLAYVHQLITNLNGNIHLKSQENLGSIFTINLPIIVSNFDLCTKEIEATYKIVTDKVEEKQINTNLPKALIVDDNIELIEYYKTIFSSFLQCTFAFNGKEALDHLKTTSFDIILSDLRMPVLDGATLKEEINKSDSLKQIPFIMITAVSYDFITDKDMTIGINDYVIKPFEKDEIITRVKALLEHKMHTKQILADENSEIITFDSSYSELLAKINTKVRENISNTDIDIKTLASEFGYTQRNLNRILQKVTGLTLVKIVLEIRLQKAYEFIVNNTYATLSEIMFETGFNSRPYFYKKFEDRFGIKAGELKKKYYL